MTLSEFTHTDESDHVSDIQTIAAVLSMHHGPDNTISSTDLAEHTKCGPSTVRDLIPEVMRIYDLPIGTSNGYFIIDSREEYARQVDRQLRQAETSRQRAQLISAAYNRATKERGESEDE